MEIYSIINDKKTIETVLKERQIGGILGVNSQDQKQTLHDLTGEHVIEGALENRLQSIERRIAALEKMIELDKKLDHLAEHNHRHDALSIELIKLVKSNIEGRLELQMKLLKLKKNLDTSEMKNKPGAPMNDLKKIKSNR